jgi:hypothetical protein
MSARTIRTCDACGIDIEADRRHYIGRTFTTSDRQPKDILRDPKPENWEACSEKCARQLLRQQAASLDEPTNMPPLSRPYR